MTKTDLKNDGISVEDSTTGNGTSNYTKREKTALESLLGEKLDGMARDMNAMFWKGGTQDDKQVLGIQSFILDDPTTNTVVAGINQKNFTWWQNQASLLINFSTPSDQNLVDTLQKEFVQLHCNYSSPDIFLVGFDFLKAYEREMREKGNYSDNADLAFNGLPIDCDPALDDLGKSKYGYILNSKTIFPMVMEGEDMKSDSPERPPDKYVIYRAVTWTGALVCKQRNANGVYSIA